MGKASPGVNEPGDERLNIIFRGKAGEPDAQSAVDLLVFHADGFQHMASPALFAGGAF